MRAHHAALVLIALACRTHDSSESRGPLPAGPSPRSAASAPDSTSPARPPQPTEILRTLYERLTAIGQNRAKVRSRLGEPALATAAAEPNAHDSAAKDTLVQWTFHQLHFTFLVVGGSDLLLETRAASDYSSVAPLISRFSTLETAEATLGAPGGSTFLADTLVYSYESGDPDIGVSQNAINLYFKGGRLIFVGALPYVD
jgi:hypothetical protein